MKIDFLLGFICISFLHVQSFADKNILYIGTGVRMPKEYTRQYLTVRMANFLKSNLLQKSVHPIFSLCIHLKAYYLRLQNGKKQPV